MTTSLERRRKRMLVASLVWILLFGGCGPESASDDSSYEIDAAVQNDAGAFEPSLVINEVMSKNDGVAIDENWETDDWIELINVGKDNINLNEYFLSDSASIPYPLPDKVLIPKQMVILWADNQIDQGPFHLPFRLNSTNEHLYISKREGIVTYHMTIPHLLSNESYARFPDAKGHFQICRYATLGTINGDTCQPPPPVELSDIHFKEFVWPQPFLEVIGPLVISELLLNPAEFIELFNVSDTEVQLSDYIIEIAPYSPKVAWPQLGQGVGISLTDHILKPNQRFIIKLNSTQVAEVAKDPSFEGVVTLFEAEQGQPIDRVDFMSWPEGVSLSRNPDRGGSFHFCTPTTPGEDNICTTIPSRPIGNRLHHIRTLSDFDQLARGGSKLGISSVKFILDMQSGDVIHLLSSWDWDLHYTFVREIIDGERHLDRCDPEQNLLFREGWVAFSQREYFREQRRYLLGTLSHHGGAGINTVEFTFGDAITGTQMRKAFFGVVANTLSPHSWSLRPQDSVQVDKARTVEGTLPIVGPNAPFVDLYYQPLTQGIAFGVLRFIPSRELTTAALGPDVIVVTDDVPNDIPMVGGLITENFQTPLSHVNVLSQNRNTPNMGLRDARNHSQIAPFIDRLVKLTVDSSDFSIEVADPEEAQRYWDSRFVNQTQQAPRLDDTIRGIQALGDHSIESLPAIGAKAAQLAELIKLEEAQEHVLPLETNPSDGSSDASSSEPNLDSVNFTAEQARCDTKPPFSVPHDALVIPVVHYMEHFRDSGAQELLDSSIASDMFRANPVQRAEDLRRVRNAIMTHELSPEFLQEVEREIFIRFGDQRVRFRSSSNAEDLPHFNGAGLYTSVSGAVGDEQRRIDDAIRTVWASLWSSRAYDERTYAGIDHMEVAMGILIHQAFLSERANGVAISRNILDPVRGDIYYLNTQIGEASVTNPAPSISTEQLTYQWPPRVPTLQYQSKSSLSPGNRVITPTEIQSVMCGLRTIHDHLRQLIDPEKTDPRFAVEIEFKLIGDQRDLMIKQARPYSFGQVDIPTDCREFE